MGDEIKVYLPRMVQPVLQLFMQDTSEQKLSTQKVSTRGVGVEGWEGGGDYPLGTQLQPSTRSSANLS